MPICSKVIPQTSRSIPYEPNQQHLEWYDDYDDDDDDDEDDAMTMTMTMMMDDDKHAC